MANQRDKSKRQVGFYASPEEKKAIEALAKRRGTSVSEMLRGIATGAIKLGVVAVLLFHGMRDGSEWTGKSMMRSAAVIADALK